jgi:hypothetical protein
MDSLSDDELIQNIFSRYIRNSNADINAIQEPARSVIAVYSAQGLIDNGGFTYFFESDFPNKSNAYLIIKESYKNIGCPHLAEALDKVLSLFPDSKLQTNLKKRQKFLSRYFNNSSKDRFPVVGWAEKLFWKNSDAVFDLAIKYYRQQA